MKHMFLKMQKTIFCGLLATFRKGKLFFAACQLIIFCLTFIYLGDVMVLSKMSDAANPCCCIVWQPRRASDSITGRFRHEFYCFFGLPQKNQVSACNPEIEIHIIFLSLHLSSKALRFFPMPVSVLGGKFRKKKGINRLGVGLKKISKFHCKSFCHADFA